MIFSVFIVLAFVLLIIKKNYKNKYSWIFSLLFLSISIIMSAILLYINKISVYRSLFQIENSISFRLNDIRISFFDVNNIIKFGMALLFFSKFCFKDENLGKNRRTSYILFLASAACVCAVYYIINSFFVTEKLYLMLNTSDRKKAEILKNVIVAFNVTVTAAAFLMPYLSLFRRYSKAAIAFKKKQCAMITAVTFIMDIFLVVIFVTGPYKNVFGIDIVLKSTYNIKRWYVYFYTFLPAALFMALIAVYMILIHYDVLNGFTVFSKKEIDRNVKLIPRDIRCVAHSFKNSFFSVVILANQLREVYGTDEGLELIDEIQSVAQESMQKAEDVSKILGKQILRVTEVSIKEIVENAVKKTVVQNARVNVGDIDENIYIIADSGLVSDALHNIILNASEAIAASGKNVGRINISVLCDNEHVCVSISDNGCGIPKKVQKKMFSPFFSTKNTNNNWGIGLYHANDVIKAHLGKIIVNSIEGEFTEFQILFPVIKRRVPKIKIKAEELDAV